MGSRRMGVSLGLPTQPEPIATRVGTHWKWGQPQRVRTLRGGGIQNYLADGGDARVDRTKEPPAPHLATIPEMGVGLRPVIVTPSRRWGLCLC